MEMREGELYQINPGKGHDYLFVVEGELKVIEDGSIRCGIVPNITKSQPITLAAAPKTSTLLAVKNSMICLADSDMLDDLLSWDEIMHVSQDEDTDLHNQLNSVRDSLAFKRLPMECVESAFQRMNTMTAKAGQEIITEGEEGDAFYIIQSGAAEVWQSDIYGEEVNKIADLAKGDTFGCEALISGKLRSETVKITEDATILVLGHDDFEKLVSTQLVRRVNPKIAKSMMETTHKILDVRYAEEHEHKHIPGSTLIPLHELRTRMNELDPAIPYIVYCHSGSRSAVAALKLSQNNFDVVSVEGGIRDWPFDTDSD
jgi:rhodanese-related sulfurtransferase